MGDTVALQCAGGALGKEWRCDGGSGGVRCRTNFGHYAPGERHVDGRSPQMAALVDEVVLLPQLALELRVGTPGDDDVVQ